ncbi:MAG: hypothetical protein NVSMB39_6260 [Candidatus Saccharimonadales bacterium]
MSDFRSSEIKNESSEAPAVTKPAPPRRPGPRYSLIAKWVCAFLILELSAVWLSQHQAAKTAQTAPAPTVKATPAPPRAGDIIAQDSSEHFTPEQTAALISHNYPGTAVNPGLGVTKIIFHYRSQLPDGQLITVYGRAYLPDVPLGNLPTFAFAPGTTGIGDQCAPSLEKPAVANWANYDSHLSAYAAKGFAAVTTDYEGMRDPGRLHHYMVGELEGRALLDAVRALRHLPQAKGRLTTNNVFFAGYSQGGHAAFWADKISAAYAPDVTPLGVVGFGPVMSVKQTLADITRGANINWFGPNVLLSYQDYYHTIYPGVVQPAREATMTADVLAHCIDTDLSYWGHTPANIYTPEFIQAAQTNTINAAFPQFAAALDANEVGAVPTVTAKRINEGAQDNVVLPAQQLAAVPQLCSSSKGPVQYMAYPNSTHYNTMLHSFTDTLAWMRNLINHGSVPSNCS